MPLTPALPTPLVKWSRYLIRGIAEGFTLLTGLNEFAPVADDPADIEWRYAVLRFQRPTPAGAVEDYAQIGINLVNITGGDIDTSWTSGDYTTCDGHFTEWWNTIKSQIQADHKLVDVRYYRRYFATPMTPEKRFGDSGPPEHILTVNSNGTSVTLPLPFQVAMSVTFKTAVPRHWGRVYMPGLPQSAADDGYGRWDVGSRTAVANAFAELMDDLGGSEFFPVVPVTQVSKVLVPGLLGVTSVQVDDIPDVIRRRRARTTLVRYVGVPTA